MSLFKNLTGTLQALFRIGGTGGVNVKHNSGAVEFRNTADNAFVTARGLQIQSSNNTADLITLLDLFGHVPLIEYSFAGASAPAPNNNAGKFGICHTTGGSYTAGDVVYDNVTALVKLNVVKGIWTTSAVSGTISLIANGMYAKEGSSFILKGDGSGTNTGVMKAIELSYDFNSTDVDSTTAIPNGARVVRVENIVVTPFNGTAPTLAVTVNGSSPLSIFGTTLSDLKTAAQYEDQEVKLVGATNEGIIRATVVSSSSSAGAGKALVFYVTPLA